MNVEMHMRTESNSNQADKNERTETFRLSTPV
jgi:hypothetical protein